MDAFESLRQRALSERVGTVCAAIAEMIRKTMFILSEVELANLELQNVPELSGWVFAYRVSRAEPIDQLQLLRTGARSTNPRVREQFCDLVGDRRLVDLRTELEVVCGDPVQFVAEAAKYNYEMLDG